jgi:hypothetical protein
MSNIEIQSNKAQDSLNAAKPLMGTPHGNAIVVFAVISTVNDEINVSITFDNEESLRLSSSQMLGAVLQNKENKVLFRSFRNDGEFEVKHSGRELTTETKFPALSSMYLDNAKLILDIDSNEKRQVWRFYRIHESQPRIMTLILRESE